MKKKLVLASSACLVASAMALGGCSGGSKPAETSAAAEKSEAAADATTAAAESGSSDTMHLSFYYPVNVGGDAAKLIEKICADFNAENPDIVVDPVYTGNYDDTVTKIQTAIQGGTPPDVFVSLATQRFTMASTGMAMPLDDLIAADGDEGKAYIDDFLSGFMEDSYVDGKIYSIPFQRSTEILFYNKDAFKEVGLDPEKAPATWDELVEDAKLLTNENRYGVGIALNSGSAQWTFTGFCLQNSKNGENLMAEDGKSVMFDTPENVEALQFWLDLQNKYEVMAPGIVQWTDLPTQFLAGGPCSHYDRGRSKQRFHTASVLHLPAGIYKLQLRRIFCTDNGYAASAHGSSTSSFLKPGQEDPVQLKEALHHAEKTFDRCRDHRIFRYFRPALADPTYLADRNRIFRSILPYDTVPDNSVHTG